VCVCVCVYECVYVCMDVCMYVCMLGMYVCILYLSRRSMCTETYKCFLLFFVGFCLFLLLYGADIACGAATAYRLGWIAATVLGVGFCLIQFCFLFFSDNGGEIISILCVFSPCWACLWICTSYIAWGGQVLIFSQATFLYLFISLPLSHPHPRPSPLFSRPKLSSFLL
jgi:hypothetical protein